MLNSYIEDKLESLSDIPTLPAYLSRVMRALDNTDIRAKKLAELIERDQTLTAKILKAANSPYYGQIKQVSTVELAIILMGLNTIKEIIIGMLLDKYFAKAPSYLFDTKAFWDYSIFCGASSRVLARKFKFKLAGEAFVAGLMHDLGILIIVQSFAHEFREIKDLTQNHGYDIVSAEKKVLKCTHADIGAWLGKHWSLPDQLCEAIEFHHHLPGEIEEELSPQGETLARIVSMAEWFASDMGFYNWTFNSRTPPLFSGPSEIEKLAGDEIFEKRSWMAILKQDINREYQKSVEFNPAPSKSLY